MLLICGVLFSLDYFAHTCQRRHDGTRKLLDVHLREKRSPRDEDALTEVRLPKMEMHQIEAVIQEQFICRVAFKDEPFPYVAPFQYVVIDGTLYLHLTDYGRKMRLLERDNRVCVEIETYAPDLSRYSFVVMRGRLLFVEDPEERTRVVKRLSQEGAKKLSDNFLAVHGLRREEGWSSLPRKQPLRVARLEADEVRGLMSPYSA
jgi:hypothetical protein